MARHFVRLKLSLLASAFKRGWQQGVGFVLGLLFGVPVALGAAVLLAASGSRTWGGPLLVVAFSLLGLGWALLPLVLFGLDETLDPARLRLLPLTSRQLVVGLLAASAVGVGPVVTLVFVLGAVPGHATPDAGAVIVLGGVVVQLALCLVLARALTTALSNRLRSRRGKDVTTMAVALGGLGFALLGQAPRFLLDAEGLDPSAVLGDVAAVLAPVPLAWPARAIVAAGEGDILLGLGWLAAALLVVVGLAAWWAGSLRRSAVTVERADPGKRGDRDLFPGPLRVLPATRLGATVAKELRYQWRVPQLRVSWLTLCVFGVALVAGVALVPALRRPLIVLAPISLAVLQAFTSLNAFGADRGAVWLLVGGGGITRADLAGKNLASGLLTLAVVLPVATAVAALTGAWSYLPLTLVVSVALLGILFAIGNVSSVLAPAPLPEAGQNVFAAASGTGCMTALLQGVAMLVTAAASVPVAAAVLAAAFLRPGLLPVAGVFAVAYGAAIWWGGLVLAGSLARERGPDILSALTR